MSPALGVLALLAGAGILAAASSKKKTGGATVPVGTGPGGGAGGGGGTGNSAPPVVPPVPPSGPPGLSFPLPQVGQAYRPNQYLRQTVAANFEGRDAVQALVSRESDPADAPKERHDHIMEWLDGGMLDEPNWIRIPVRGGLEVEVMADVVSMGGVRLCGPMRSAQAIADAWDAMIMTPGIVDATWKARSLTLAPQSFGWWSDPQTKQHWINPGGGVPWMLYECDLIHEELTRAANEFIFQHGAAALPALQAALSGILATLGKDYVLEYRATQHPGNCAIYGWHRTDGSVIQSAESGASYVHYLDFFDYSHKIRLVRRRCWLSNVEADLADVYRTKPDLVNWTVGEPAPPVRYPSLPPRSASNV